MKRSDIYSLNEAYNQMNQVRYIDKIALIDRHFEGSSKPVIVAQANIGKEHKDIIPIAIAAGSDNYEHGFLDNKGEFLNRKDALILAKQTDQVIDLNQVVDDELTSQNCRPYNP